MKRLLFGCLLLAPVASPGADVSIPGGGSSAAALIVGADPSVGFVGRLDNVHALPRELSPAAAAALTAFLEEPFDSLGEVEVAVLRNDVADRLRRSNAAPETVVAALRRAHEDPRHSHVWRTYCLQHLGHFLPHLADAPREASLALLWSAVTSDDQAAFAGTALIALAAYNGPDVDNRRLADAAVRLAADSEGRDAARLSAMQVLHERGAPRAAGIARQILAESHSVPLRLIALTALGDLGGPDDVASIRPYLNNPIPAFRRTARRANVKWTARFASSGEHHP